MNAKFERFQKSLEEPLTFRSRVLLAILVVPLVLVFTAPLWKISMKAPQYPAGLELEIRPYTVTGDVSEINTLNHYIGMSSIDRASLSDLDWIPFALGALIVFALRVAAIGNVRSLVDLFVMFAYFSVFSMARFVYRLYVFGHDLDPKAAFDVDPFMPAILGTKTVANFTITSLPGVGSLWIGLFLVGLLVTIGINLNAQRSHAS